MSKVIKFPEMRFGPRRFFGTEKSYKEYLKQENKLKEKPIEPFLTLKALLVILLKR